MYIDCMRAMGSRTRRRDVPAERLCHPFGDAAVDVGPRVARRALSHRSGPAGASKRDSYQRRPRGQLCSATKKFGSPNVPPCREDVGMLIEVVAETHGAGLHRPDHTKVAGSSRRHAIDVFRSRQKRRPVHILCQADPDREKNIFLRRAGMLSLT